MRKALRVTAVAFLLVGLFALTLDARRHNSAKGTWGRNECSVIINTVGGVGFVFMRPPTVLVNNEDWRDAGFKTALLTARASYHRATGAVYADASVNTFAAAAFLTAVSVVHRLATRRPKVGFPL